MSRSVVVYYCGRITRLLAWGEGGYGYRVGIAGGESCSRLFALRLTFVGNEHEEVRHVRGAHVCDALARFRIPFKHAISGACLSTPGGTLGTLTPVQHGVGYSKTKKHTNKLSGEERGRGGGKGRGSRA